MADGNTTNYNFVLPEVGASQDTWGTKLNQNWTDLDTDLNDLETTKADLASPALTGTPTAPTAAADTNTTQIATTAYVQGELTDMISGVTAGTGLSGGGSSGDVTLNLDFSELTDKTTDIAGTTEFILQDGTTESRKAASEIKLSAFNNDSGWTTNTGTVTSVTGGAGLTGSVTTTGSLAVGAGTAISVAADSVSVSFGTTSSTACVGNDSRLSNSRQCNNSFDDAATSRTNLGLGTLATLSTVNAATITDNSVGAAELNVSGNGSSGQYLASDGDGTMTWTTLPSGSTPPTVQVFTSSGTWTRPASCKAVRVTVIGGGGAGGDGTASNNSNANYVVAGGGGGGGGGAVEIINVENNSSTETVTIGAGGTNGAGGASSFGAFCSANGGGVGGSANSGGYAAGNPGGGGNGVGGSYNVVGKNGHKYASVSSSSGFQTNARGGCSALGFGRGASQGNGSTGGSGAGYGGGGAGGTAGISGTGSQNRQGGAGTAGIVIVEEFY